MSLTPHTVAASLPPLPPADPDAPVFQWECGTDGTPRARIAGELDYAAEARLRQFLLSLPSTPELPPLILDLTAVTFLDCATLNALVRVVRALPSGSVRVEMAATGQPRRMVALLGMEAALGLLPLPRRSRHA